jgi:TRIAD3 protein (E3 ubiquitin-protein ligase RNF216)
VRTCPCGNRFIKDQGCNKMHCSCGVYMCYLCEQVIEGYSHFCSCPNKDTCTNCHIYSDPERWYAQRLKNALQTL